MLIFLLHAAATLFMTGLIWTIQIVHYPLFAKVGSEGYEDYQWAHQKRISFVVIPAMFLELGTAVWLIFENPREPLVQLGLGMLVLIWLSTALLQAPIHSKLTHGWDAALHGRLVRTNWIRTVLWTARGVVALWMIKAAFPPLS
jgi:uncharacterized membrane protein